MIEWIILVFSFFTLYLGIFWLQVVSFKEEEQFGDVDPQVD